jgi:hypothetical protein
MGTLGDIMGDDFEEKYEEKSQSRREEANKVEKEVLMEICYKAIEAGGFDGEEPRFRFDAGGITHDVLLMESPADDLQTFRWPLGDSAKTQGMFHLEDLFSLAFQENMLDLLDKIETDQYYLVVGKYEETTQSNSDGEEETYYNINPVRGILPLEAADKYASQYKNQMEGSSIQEQSQAQSGSSGDSESGSGGSTDSSDIDLGGSEDGGSSVSDDEIIEIFHLVADKSEQVMREVTQGDSDAMDQLSTVVSDNVDGDVTEERIFDVFEEAVEEIDGREEEDDSDDLDLGGIGGGETDSSDSQDDESESETEAEEDSEPEAPTAAAQATTDSNSGGDESSGDSDEETDVDSWF